MDPNSRLFLDAFGNSDDGKKIGAKPIGDYTSNDHRTELFKASFRAPSEMPAARTTDYRLNSVRAGRLNSIELFQLQGYFDAGTPWNELPDWVRDGQYVTPDKATKKREDRLTEETGYNTSERAQMINSLLAETSALADMCKSPVLKDSPVLDQMFEQTFQRFGKDQVLEELAGIDPSAHDLYTKRALLAEAAEKEAQRQAAESSSEEQTRADIKWAQDQLAMLRNDAAMRNEEGEL